MSARPLPLLMRVLLLSVLMVLLRALLLRWILDEVTGTVSNIGALTVSNAAQAAGLLVSTSTQGLQSVSNEGAIKVSANESATSQAVAIGTDGAQDVTNMAAIEVDKANSAAGMQVKNFNTLINSGEFKVSGGVAAGVFADNGQTSRILARSPQL